MPVSKNDIVKELARRELASPQKPSAEQINKSLREFSRRTPGKVNPIAGSINAALQGASFGFADEILAPLLALLLPEGNNPLTSEDVKALNRNISNQFFDENPVLATGSTIAGGLLTGGVGATKALGTQFGQAHPLLTTMLLGAGGGGVAGAGFSEGETPGEIAIDTGIGAGFGFVLPAALRGMLGLGRQAARIPKSIPAAVQRVTNTQDEAAARQVERAFQQDNVPLTDIPKKLAELGSDAVPADAGGQNVLRLLERAGAGPGKTAQQLEKFASERVAKSSQRLVADLQKSLGVNKSAFTAAKNLIEQAKRNSGPLYREVDQTLVTIDDDLMSLLQRPAMRKAWTRGIKKAQSDLEWPSDITIPSAKALRIGKTIPLRALDWTKRALDDSIEGAQRGKSPSRDNVRIFTQLKRALTDRLDDQFPVYAQARAEYAGPAAVRSAIEQGKKVLLTDADEMADVVSTLGKSEWHGYVTGAVQAMSNKLKGATGSQNAANKLGTILVRERIRGAFPTDEAADQFMKSLQREDVFAQLRNVATRGSQTAQRLATGRDLAVDSAQDLARGRFISGGLDIIAKRLNEFRDIPEPVKNRIGDILLGDIVKNGQITNKALNRIAKTKLSAQRSSQLVREINASLSLPITETAIAAQ